MAAADNFGWLGGALSVFRRRRRRMIPAGVGGAIRRLRGLPSNTYVQYGILKLTPSTCSDISRVSDTGRGSRQIVLIEAGGFYPGIYGKMWVWSPGAEPPGPDEGQGVQGLCKAALEMTRFFLCLKH